MSKNLRELLQDLAAVESANAAAVAPDPSTTLRRTVRDIRTRRARHRTLVGAAAVMVLAAGAATATALLPTPPVPAVVDPVPTATITPTPSSTHTPSASPTSSTRPDDEDAAPITWGVVGSLASPPRELWTLAVDAVATPGGPVGERAFADVRTGAPYGHFEAIEAGDVLVTSVAGQSGQLALAGLDAATGTVLWVDDADVPEQRTGLCVGTSSEGLVVCRNLNLDDGNEIRLVDPANGTVVRAYPLDFRVDAMGLAGDTIVAHGTTDPTTARWDGIDSVTGETRWSHIEPGAASDAEPAGDAFAWTEVLGDVARLYSYRYTAIVDTRTGERAPAAELAQPYAIFAPRAGLSVPVLELGDGATGTIRALRALDPVDGSELWTHEADLTQVLGVIDDGVIVAAGPGDNPSLSFLDLTTGELRWTAESGGLWATDGERILVGTLDGRGVRALSIADGSVVWTLAGTGGHDAGIWISREHLAVNSTSEVRMYAW